MTKITHAEVVAAASKINHLDVDVDVFGGPAGGNGFRKGYWTATYKGETFKFFDSIPHGMDLDDQKARLQKDACGAIAAKQLGY